MFFPPWHRLSVKLACIIHLFITRAPKVLVVANTDPLRVIAYRGNATKVVACPWIQQVLFARELHFLNNPSKMTTSSSSSVRESADA